MKYTKSYIKDRDIKMNIGIVCCYSKFQAIILKLFFLKYTPNYLMHMYICLNFSLHTHIMIIDRKVQIKRNFRS